MAREIALRIVVDEAVRFGPPVVRVTCMPVEVLVGKVAGGMAVEAVAEDGVTREDVLGAISYAARRLEEEQIQAI